MRPSSYRISLYLKALCLALALTLCTPSNLPARPLRGQQTQKRQLPPRQYIPSRDYDTLNITLNLRFNWEQEQAIGTATISFAPLSANLRRVEFDAANMTFNSVKLAGGAPLKFETDTKNEKLHVILDRAYQPANVITVVIDYHTNGVSEGSALVSSNQGLSFIKPRADDPNRPRQIWSQGESEYNHFWFPCFDHPNDFATTEMIATVDKPLMVISNGRLIETIDNKDNTRTFHWKMEQPHASYLTSIVVGEYTPIEQKYQDVPVISYVYPNEVKEGRVTVARMADMVRFFSEKTGVKYPYAKYAQTMTRDFGGGMENISATTQTDNMIHDARFELDNDSDGLQSHELAHQWFGDYVTCRSWSDIWLNESFATYFQAMWDEHRLGHDDFLYLDVKGNQDAYYAAWRNGLRRPIVTSNYQNPDAVFDTYAYPRGGAVLHMLRMTLGEGNWWRSINHYLTKYAHQPVETEQLRIAIEETTGMPMDWFFEEWVYKMGHPVFRVTKNYDAAAKTLTLTVRQEQKPDPAYDYPQAGLFRTPVDIEIGTGTDTKVFKVTRVWIEPKEEQSFTFPVDSEPRLVNFDYGNTIIKELRFDKPTDELVYQLTRDEDVMGRMWALGQLSEKLKATATVESEKQQIAQAVSTALASDRVWGMRVEAAAALTGVAVDTARTALLAAAKDRDARVRARAIASLGASKDPTLASVYLEHLSDESYATIREAAKALGQAKSPAAYDALLKLSEMPSWRDTIKVSALNGLAALGDPRALELGFRYAATGNPINVRNAAITLLAAVGRDEPRAFTLISDTFRQAVTARNQMLRTSAEAIISLGDKRGLEVFEQARKQAGVSADVRDLIGNYERRLQQAVDRASPAKPTGQ
ncbi:MAG TPA: M1 family aminopeptidase [Pyrinomonadaceae bacterium]